MKLVHEDLDSIIAFKENVNNVIVIENPSMFCKFIEDLNRQLNGDEGGFVLSIEDKVQDISKSLILLTDMFNISLNDKKIISRVYKNIKESCYESDNYNETVEIQSDIIAYIEKIISNLDYEMEYNTEIDLTSIFKILDLRMVEKEISILAKVINYIKIINELSLAKCVIAINLKSYLNQEEIQMLYKELNYNKISLLLLENKEYARCSTENVIIIDKDLCEI